MDFLERIGPILGIAAFLGFSILAVLVFLQAREVRRLREWAGRAPERKLEADEATQAAAEAREELESGPAPGRIAALRERIAGRFGPVIDELDRRSPVDLRWLLALLAAAIIAAAVLTSGFGLLGNDDGGGGEAPKAEKKEEEKLPKVAVLNATATTVNGVPVDPIPNLAADVSVDIVQPLGYKVKTEATAITGEEDSVVMYEEGEEKAAKDFADALQPELGEIEIVPMVQEVRDLAKGANVALLVGLDDKDLGSTEPAAE